MLVKFLNAKKWGAPKLNTTSMSSRKNTDHRSPIKRRTLCADLVRCVNSCPNKHRTPSLQYTVCEASKKGCRQRTGCLHREWLLIQSLLVDILLGVRVVHIVLSKEEEPRNYLLGHFCALGEILVPPFHR